MGCRQAVRHQTLTLASVGSNPAIPANKKGTFVYQKFLFCLSKPQAWYIIAARSAVHIISPCGAVSHHAPACIFSCGLMIYKAYALIYCRKCDIME